MLGLLRQFAMLPLVIVGYYLIAELDWVPIGVTLASVAGYIQRIIDMRGRP